MYVTRQGECWDEAARKVYGSETYTDFLMKSNMPLLDVVVFSDGTVLQTPELPKEEEKLPPWKKGERL